MDLPLRLLAGFGQRLDKILPVDVVEEDLGAPACPAIARRRRIATAHHMIHGPSVFQAWFTRHTSGLHPTRRAVKQDMRMFMALPKEPGIT